MLKWAGTEIEELKWESNIASGTETEREEEYIYIYIFLIRDGAYKSELII